MLAWKRLLSNGMLFRYMATSSTKMWQPLVRKMLTQAIEPQKAFDQFKELVKDNPTDLTLLGRYSGLLYHYRSFMDLPDLLDKIKAADSDSLLIPYFKALVNLDIGFPQETVKIFDYVQSLKRELKPIEMLYKALLLRRLGRPLEALKLINTFLSTEEGKEDFEATLEKIQLQLEANQPKDALELVNELLKNDPRNIEFRFYKAIALRGLNEAESAVTEFTTLLSDITDVRRKALIFLERARCRQIADLEGKLADLNEAKKLNPGTEIDREMLISYYMANKLEDTEPLMKELEKNYDISHDYPMLLIKGAILRYMKQDYKNALEIYKKLKELAPASVKEHFTKQITVLEDKVKNLTPKP